MPADSMAKETLHKVLWPVAVLVVAAIYLSPAVSMPVQVFDEGSVLAGADRIQKGELPFEDFYTVYPPGQYYVLAWLFEMFGSSVTVGRIYDLFVKSLLTLSVFLLIEEISRSKAAAIAGSVMSLVYISWTSLPLYPMYPALLLTIIALYCYLRHVATGNLFWVILSAFGVVVCSAVRHDFAFYCGLSLLLAMSIEVQGSRVPRWSAIRLFMAAGVGFGLLVAVYVASVLGTREVISQLILLPARYMERYRGLPYPGLSIANLWFYVVPLILALGLIVSVKELALKRETDRVTHGLALTSLYGALLLNQVRVRSDVWHLVPVAIFGFVVLCVLWQRARPIDRRSLSTVAYTGLLLTFLVMLVPAIDWNVRSFFTSFPIDVDGDLPRAGIASVPADLARVVSYVSASTAPDDSIYVGVENHDRFMVNHAIVYYLANRRYATKYHQFDPGITNGTDAQERIVADLAETRPVKLVLTESYWYEDNATKDDLKIDIVDDYIRSTYAHEVTFGEYEVWSRKPGGA